MTKAQIKSQLATLIDGTTSAGQNDTLTQPELTEITDAIAADLGDTVNPNGPYYPSTPRP